MSFEETTTEDHERRIGRCRADSCRARIIWLKTDTGKRMPVDADSVEPADETYDPAKHVSHFKTCAAPNRFSGSNKQ